MTSEIDIRWFIIALCTRICELSHSVGKASEERMDVYTSKAWISNGASAFVVGRKPNRPATFPYSARIAEVMRTADNSARTSSRFSRDLSPPAIGLVGKG